jgi:hypothetical protein
MVLTARSMRLPVNEETIIGNLMNLLEDTREEEHFMDKEGNLSLVPLNNWYYSWLKAYNLNTEHAKPVEVSRVQWTRPENLKAHYKIVADTAVQVGWPSSTRILTRTSLTPHKQMILWVKPARIVSLDEKKIIIDQNSRNRTNRTVTVPEMKDTGDIVATKSTNAAALVAGSRGDFQPLRPMTIYGSGTSLDPRWHGDDEPTTTLINEETGKPHRPLYYATKKGSMDEQRAVRPGVLQGHRVLVPRPRHRAGLSRARDL